jgi:Fuc2NAc and GlcNAc transferase
MIPVLVVAAAATGLASLLMVRLLISYAQARGVLDIPNERSSHSRPTARGGGLAIVACVLAVVAGLGLRGELPGPLGLVLLAGGGAVALVGWLDDRHGLAVPVRLLVHLAACAGASALLWPGPATGLALLVTTVALAWLLNLYNFMDGIDGLAGVQAVSMAAGTALLLAVANSGDPALPGLLLVCVVTAASAAGFLAWNWPPAAIFLGDAGSGFLGFLFGVLALASLDAGVSPWAWLILPGVFVVDATATLLRRLLRGERVSEGHRSHAYQRLARHWGGHRPVTLAAVAVNLFWLLPMAVAAQLWPVNAVPLLVLAWLPLLAAWAWGSWRLPSH